jgi:hypothetical protein
MRRRHGILAPAIRMVFRKCKSLVLQEEGESLVDVAAARKDHFVYD